MSELVKVTRQEGEEADICKDWLPQWESWGWKAATTDDGLDAMDQEKLHALAKERDVKVHANAGADKVREALRQAAKA